jgi:hypothetical protein
MQRERVKHGLWIAHLPSSNRMRKTGSCRVKMLPAQFTMLS